MQVSGEALVGTAATAVVNVYPLVHRISTLNRSQTPLVEGIAYLVGCVLVREGHELATELLYEPEQFFEIDERLTGTLNSERIRPVLATLYDQLAVHCSSTNYCPKVHHRDPAEKPEYFARFRKGGAAASADEVYLVMNSTQNECQLGIVETAALCPLPVELPDRDLTRADVRELMAFAESVLKCRVAELGSER